ncbi:MAG: trigger factor [Desulfobacterales bacterium]|nr:trigger factor [Desulfobacterales bacterium]
MQVTVEDLSSVKKVLHIEIPEGDIVPEIDKAYKNLMQTVKIKGFRPGRIPRSVVERRFNKDVHADVISQLIQRTLFDAIKEHDIKILGNPQLDPPEFTGKGPYQYDATIEIKPAMDDIEFKGLNLEKTLYQVSEDEIEQQLKMLQKNMTQLITVSGKRPVQEGDVVLIDYEGAKDGNPFPETKKKENISLKIGDGTITRDFDNQLIGLNPGDNKNFKLLFPEKYFNDKLAGLEIDFQVNLKEIREELVPDINDDLAKELGQFETLSQLKDEIRNNLSKSLEKRAEQELHEQIFQTLIGRKALEVPQILVDYELGQILTDAQRTFAQYNMSFEQAGITREALIEKYRDAAENQVRRYLILNKIIEQENMSLSEQNLEDGFRELAENSNQPAAQIKNYYTQNADKLEIIKQTLLEKEAMKLIIDNSITKEVAPKSKPEAGLTNKEPDGTETLEHCES